MLVLSRRVGQQIRIGTSVVVTLLKVERNKARLGVEAPPDVRVYRQELLEFEKVRSAASPRSPTPDRPPFREPPSAARPAMQHISGPRFLWDNAAG